MGRSFLTVVTREDPGDGRTLPRWAGGNDVHPEAGDGPGVVFPVPGLDIGELGSDLRFDVRMTGLSGRVRVTGSRVVVVCRRFEAKGGGWFGLGWGAVFALVANLVSKARVAARGAGKAAVGHVRHEDLSFVGWRSTATGGSANEVRLGFRRPGLPVGVVDLHIPRDLDPALIAMEIVRSAARHRLATGHAPDPALTALAESTAAPATTSGFATVRFPDPTPRPVSPSGAPA